jgi:predicted ribosome-associated RNA-binding protein Tma20
MRRKRIINTSKESVLENNQKYVRIVTKLSRESDKELLELLDKIPTRRRNELIRSLLYSALITKDVDIPSIPVVEKPERKKKEVKVDEDAIGRIIDGF